jgi:hypothetical protein
MILPIVMYHGVTPWSEPRLFDALLDVPASVRPAVAPYLVEFAYLLNDLSETSDEDLRNRAMLTSPTAAALRRRRERRHRANQVAQRGRVARIRASSPTLRARARP